MKILENSAYVPDPRDPEGNTLIFQSDDVVENTDEPFKIGEKVEIRFPDSENLLWNSLGQVVDIDHSDLPFLLFVKVLWNSAVPWVDESS